MALEAVPTSVSADDNLRIVFVLAASDPTSVAALAAGEDLTYGFTSSGFNRTTTQATIPDPRLTLLQNLTRPGKVTEGLEVQYVFGGGDGPQTVLQKGAKGFIVARYAVPNETAWTVAQVVDIIPIEAGVQRKDAPTENGVFTIAQTIFVTGTVQSDVALVA